MISVEDLLKPVSADKPCGDDPAFSPDFRQLDILIRGKQETMLSKAEDKAEEPNWNQIENLCLKLLAESKHLHVAVVLSLAWLKTRGLPGFCEGTALISGLLEHYWDPIYPRLDPDDRNDPTERLNILSALCAPPGTLGDIMRFVVRIRQAPLCEVRNTQISTSDIIKAETNAPDARSLMEIKNGFGEAAPADVQATHRAIADALVHVNAIDAILARVVDPSHRRSWQELVDVLEDAGRRLTRYAPQSVGQSENLEAANAEAQTMNDERERTGEAASIAGAIRSRQDVVRALDLICDYYSRFEPSSPIPLLLRRAQRLVDKDFMEIINELTPEALASLKVIMGEQVSPEAGDVKKPV